MKQVLRWFSILPLLFMLALIFLFSAQDGDTSGSLSYTICCYVVKILSRLFPHSISVFNASLFDTLHLLIRKAAHVSEFFILCGCFYLPIAVLLPLKKHVTGKRLLLSFFPTVICAALDELHQTMVSGRCGTPIDVCIDSIGIVFFCLLVFLISLIKTRRNTSKE